MEFIGLSYDRFLEWAFDEFGESKKKKKKRLKITNEFCGYCTKSCNKHCSCRCHIASCKKCDNKDCNYELCLCNCHKMKTEEDISLGMSKTLDFQIISSTSQASVVSVSAVSQNENFQIINSKFSDFSKQISVNKGATIDNVYNNNCSFSPNISINIKQLDGSVSNNIQNKLLEICKLLCIKFCIN